jgi:hypothetical protein
LITGEGDSISTGETYRRKMSANLPILIMMRNLSPLCSLLRQPIPIFQLVIWPSTMPEVEEHLELQTFKGSELEDMEAHLLG